VRQQESLTDERGKRTVVSRANSSLGPGSHRLVRRPYKEPSRRSAGCRTCWCRTASNFAAIKAYIYEPRSTASTPRAGGASRHRGPAGPAAPPARQGGKPAPA